MRPIGIVFAAGLLSAVLAAPALAGFGGCHEPEQTEAATATVHMRENCFGPTIARIAPGDTVTFVNDDPLPHTVTGANLLWGSTEQLAQSGTIEATFAETGVYPYVCVLHPGMNGAVVVDDAVGTLAAGSDPAADASSTTPDAGWGPVALGAVAGLGLAGVIAAVTRLRRSEG